MYFTHNYALFDLCLFLIIQNTKYILIVKRNSIKQSLWILLLSSFLERTYYFGGYKEDIILLRLSHFLSLSVVLFCFVLNTKCHADVLLLATCSPPFFFFYQICQYMYRYTSFFLSIAWYKYIEYLTILLILNLNFVIFSP